MNREPSLLVVDTTNVYMKLTWVQLGKLLPESFGPISFKLRLSLLAPSRVAHANTRIRYALGACHNATAKRQR